MQLMQTPQSFLFQGKRPPLAMLTFLAMLLGIGIGWVAGTHLLFLGVFSSGIVTMIKWLSLPLIFLAILDGFLKAEFQGRGFLALLAIALLNSTLAVSIALILSNVFVPGKYLPAGFSGELKGSSHEHWWSDFARQFSWESGLRLLTGTTLVIVLALVFGSLILVLRRFKKSPAIDEALSSASRLTTRGLHYIFTALDWIVLLLPLAVFCSVVKAVGAHGFSIARGLAAYFLACATGMLLHVLVVYCSWIRWAGRISLRTFWNAAMEPALYAFGINSSLATLPMTLKALDQLKVSPSSARLSACVGTNFNNDGILLYEVVAALFIAQACGLELSLPAQGWIAIISVIACIGVAGIPEAGIISLSLVLSSVGLPTESLAFLLTVDWVLARLRSFTNVLGDITVGVGIDRLTSQGRFSQPPKIL